MKEEIRSYLLTNRKRMLKKGVFGSPGDSFSMRIPGEDRFLLTVPENEDVLTVSLDEPSAEVETVHAEIYRVRRDAGALLLSETPWSAALARLGETIPVLFDEQARHIGQVSSPVAAGDWVALIAAISGYTNIAIVGDKRLCLGVTPDRIVFNAELFEKCAMAFLIAHSSGGRIHTIPWLVRYIAAGRLKKDQRRAAESLAAGKIPEGMNAY